MKNSRSLSFGAVVIIIYGPNNQLIVVRNMNHPDPKWKFPVGHIRAEESPMKAAIRELKEETHLTVAEKNMRILLKPLDMGTHFIHVHGAVVSNWGNIPEDCIRDGKALLKVGLLTPEEIQASDDFLPAHKGIFLQFISS